METGVQNLPLKLYFFNLIRADKSTYDIFIGRTLDDVIKIIGTQKDILHSNFLVSMEIEQFIKDSVRNEVKEAIVEADKEYTKNSSKEQFILNTKLIAEEYVKNKKDKDELIRIINSIKL